jgi:hypothetical protein
MLLTRKEDDVEGRQDNRRSAGSFGQKPLLDRSLSKQEPLQTGASPNKRLALPQLATPSNQRDQWRRGSVKIPNQNPDTETDQSPVGVPALEALRAIEQLRK